jgi:hypothetical protein
MDKEVISQDSKKNGTRQGAALPHQQFRFFWALRYEANRCFHKNRVSLFLTVSGRPPDG